MSIKGRTIKKAWNFLIGALVIISFLTIPVGKTFCQHLTCGPYPSTYNDKSVWFTIQFDNKPEIDIPAVPLREMDDAWQEKAKEVDPSVNKESYSDMIDQWVVMWYLLDWLDDGNYTVVARAKVGNSPDEISDPSVPLKFTRSIPSSPTELELIIE